MAPPDLGYPQFHVPTWCQFCEVFYNNKIKKFQNQYVFQTHFGGTACRQVPVKVTGASRVQAH